MEKINTMIASFLLVALLFPWIRIYAKECRNSYSLKNVKLQGHMIKSLSRSEGLQCVNDCALHEKCHSINFHEDKRNCELNNGNHLSDPESLVSSYGYVYMDYILRPVTNCSHKLCSEPLPKCQMLHDGIGQSYNCAEVFHFPRKSNTDSVILENAFSSNLTAFTVALWVQMDPSSDYPHTPFSYATSSTSNEILIFFRKLPKESFQKHPKTTEVWIGFKWFKIYNDTTVDGKWHHVCVTWENVEGNLNFYIDGLLVKFEKNVQTGRVITKGVIVLGQEQDEYKGGFDRNESLLGNLTNVNMWDKVLTAQEIANLTKSCTAGKGNIVKWSDLKEKGERRNVGLFSTSACGRNLHP